jgi:hypothetical protein
VISDLKTAASLVIGVFGRWGEGKSSTINLVSWYLKNKDGVVVVPFNPWLFTSEEALLRSFFNTLAAAIGKSLASKKEELGEFIQKYGRALSLASIRFEGTELTIDPGAGAAAFGAALSSVDLQDLKERIQELLKTSQIRLVVLIDEIDRLERSEIQTIFRLVKLTADFPYTVYVLALDVDMVAHALGERFSNGGAESGRAFLEKIIQIPLHLPSLDETLLRTVALEGAERAVKAAGIELTEEQANLFLRMFIGGLQPRLLTPRHAVLYSNVLMFALPLLKGEVNAVDHMLIEGIRLLYPQLYEHIRTHPEIYVAGLLEGADTNERNTHRNAIEQVLLPVGKDNAGIKTLLRKLFPRVDTAFGGGGYDRDWERTWANEQRICSREYFPRYFQYTVPPTQVADERVAEMLRAVERDDELDADISQLISGRDADNFLNKLRRKIDELPPSAAIKLTKKLVAHGDKFSTVEGPFGISVASQAGIVIADLLKRIGDTTQRTQLAEEVIRDAPSLPFAVDCFRWIRTGKDEPDEDRVVPRGAERHLGRILAARIRDTAAAVPPYTGLPQQTPALLWIWKEYGPEKEVSQYLENRLAAAPNEAITLITTYVPHAWSLDTGLRLQGDLERDAFNALAGLVDPHQMMAHLRKQFPDFDGKTYPKDHTLPFLERIAKQFAFLLASTSSEPGA